jgi:TRAP-type mannitol/chloroaromatic compound transport system permease small subunit
MAETATPRRPDRGAARWFGGFTMVLNVIGTVLILVMGVAVNTDILGRNLLNEPVPGVTEFVGLSIVAVVFLQMANTLREDRHISNDLIFKAIGATHPVVAHTFYGLFHLIGAVLMALILWYVWPILLDNYEGDYYKGTAGVVEIPVWPFMATVVVGAAATVVQYGLCAWAEFRNALAKP